MCNNIPSRLSLCLDTIPTRRALAFMAFLGLMTTQMIRANLYIAIVGMVPSPHDGNIASNESNYQEIETPTSTTKFDWDETTQGLLFGAFYWCYWLTELPGGVMAQRWGGRKVLGVGVFTAGVLHAFVPLASKLHYGMLAAVRALQGLALGVTWPAMHNLAGRWIPFGERGKIMNIYHGAAIGTALTYPVCGLIMDSFGWELTFYLIAAINVFWSIGCYFFIYDNPEKHPRISIREKEYLRKHLPPLNNMVVNPRSISTPWLKILTSGPFWAVAISSLGIMWGSITLSMQLPTYLKKELMFDLKVANTFQHCS